MIAITVMISIYGESRSKSELLHWISSLRQHLRAQAKDLFTNGPTWTIAWTFIRNLEKEKPHQAQRQQPKEAPRTSNSPITPRVSIPKDGSANKRKNSTDNTTSRKRSKGLATTPRAEIRGQNLQPDLYATTDANPIQQFGASGFFADVQSATRRETRSATPDSVLGDSEAVIETIDHATDESLRFRASSNGTPRSLRDNLLARKAESEETMSIAPMVLSPHTAPIASLVPPESNDFESSTPKQSIAARKQNGHLHSLTPPTQRTMQPTEGGEAINMAKQASTENEVDSLEPDFDYDITYNRTNTPRRENPLALLLMERKAAREQRE